MGIVKKRHYAASKLPKDLRDGIPDGALVSVTVAEERRKPFSIEELKAQIERAKSDHHEETTIEQAVERIRSLRDEWDD